MLRRIFCENSVWKFHYTLLKCWKLRQRLESQTFHVIFRSFSSDFLLYENSCTSVLPFVRPMLFSKDENGILRYSNVINNNVTISNWISCIMSDMKIWSEDLKRFFNYSTRIFDFTAKFWSIQASMLLENLSFAKYCRY